MNNTQVTRRKVTDQGMVKTIESGKVVYRSSGGSWEWSPTDAMVYGIAPLDLDKSAHYYYMEHCEEC